jgi:AraC-like DNA-binding protein
MERDKPYLKPALSLQDVAKATGYSRNQISFALNHALGTTFYAFINRARIEYILLVNADLKAGGVQHLAESAGFRSVSTFYAAFRSVTGKSPRDHFIQPETRVHRQRP